MKTYLSLSISIVIIILNILIGHYFAPNGILFTPIVIMAVALIIGSLTMNIKPFWRSSLIVAFISIHDIGIKLYAGGTHDREGAAWILLYMLLGTIPAFSFLIWVIIKDKKEVMLHKLIAIVTFPALLFLHIYLSQDVGF